MRPATWSTRSPKPRSKAAGLAAVRLGTGATNLLQQLSCTVRTAGPLVRTRPSGLPDNASDDASYFFLPEAKVGCHAEAFWLGAAAITLIFSFLGFLASRFPLCWRLAMSISLGLRVTQELDPNRANVVSQVSSRPERRCAFRSYSDLSVRARGCDKNYRVITNFALGSGNSER